jgi:16S rRNA (cytosine1402-N4)-methyltransferase
MTNLTQHQPVLLKEVLDSINLNDCQTVVDGTLGLGGYSEAVLQTNPRVKVVAFELDEENLRQSKERLEPFGNRVNFVNDNFANLKWGMESVGEDKADAIMLDLGLSSPQVDQAERGFSFMREGALDMRFGKSQRLTAREVVNKYSLEELTRIFREYGEERAARKIAEGIVERRKQRTFEKTTELAEFISDLLGGKKQKIHPATRVFQALRIEVNKELDSLVEVLKQAMDVLKVNGRLAVVSYHSLEDRIVKNFLRENSREYVNMPDELTTRKLQPAFKLISKKPIAPSAEEIRQNPRARSAKLRVAEKI